jgi:hypothetical protein
MKILLSKNGQEKFILRRIKNEGIASRNSLGVSGSVADSHPFDADPDPEPTFHFDAAPDPDPDPSIQIKAKNLENVLN